MTIARTIIALPLLLISVSADAAGVEGFALRNQHPFLHVYGLPALQGAVLADPGKSRYGATFTVVNHSEQKDTETESIVLDGETYFVDFNFRRRIHERLEIGVDVPLETAFPGLPESVAARVVETVASPAGVRLEPLGRKAP